MTGMRPELVARNRRQAFTLTELVVATGVTMLLAGIMLGIVSNVIGISGRATGSIQGHTQATMALDVFSRDLQAAIVMATDEVWLAANVQPDQSGVGDTGGSLGLWDPSGGGTGKPGWSAPGTAGSSLNLDPTSDELEDYRFGMAGMWLRFTTHVPDHNVGGLDDFSAPRAVGYQIVRHRLNADPNASIRYGLFRTEVRSYDETPPIFSTFHSGYDVFHLDYCQPGVGGSSDGDPGRIRGPFRPHLLAVNVIDFGIRVFERNASGDLVLSYPLAHTDLGYAATRDATASQPTAATVEGVDYSGYTTRGFPEVVEVSMRVISEDGARLLEGLETGSPIGSDWWSVALAHSQVFSRRVVLKAQPLRR